MTQPTLDEINKVLQEFKTRGVAVVTIEPTLREQAIKGLQALDGFDGKRDGIVERDAVRQTMRGVILGGDKRPKPETLEALRHMDAELAKLPAKARIHYDKVAEAVGDVLGAIDSNNDWRITADEITKGSSLKGVIVEAVNDVIPAYAGAIRHTQARHGK